MRKKPLPEYGDLFTLEEFIKFCDDFMFTDYDGVGEYSDGEFVYGIDVYPSDIERGDIHREFTHVMWYNR